MYSGKLRLENGEEYDVTADGVLYNNNRLDQELDDMKDDIETVDGKADTNAGNISSLSSRVGEAESDISALESTTAGHTSSISTLSSTVSTHTSGKINTQDGEHGIRFYNDKLSYKDSNDTWQDIETGGSGGTGDYPDLTNKPSINGVELLGNKVIGLLSSNIQVDSDKIGYDNLTSGLSATNVKSALDELANNDIDSYSDLSNLPSINGTQLLGNKVIGLLSANIQVDSDKIGYNNTISGLSANNVKSAIDELKNAIPQSSGKGQSGTGTNSEIFNDYTNNTASGNYSHSEGYDNDAVGLYSHAEGSLNTATGAYSHAEGQWTHAKVLGSHSSGLGTIAGVNYETVVGRYNVEEDNSTSTTRFAVGNGADQNNRSDSFKVTDTEIHLNGDIKHNGTNLITASTTDITANTTSLTTGNLYVVYEA